MSETQAAPGPAPVPRPTLVMAAMIALAALAIGVLGGFMLGGGAEGPANVAPPELETGDVDRRSDELGIDASVPEDVAAPQEPAPETGNASTVPPADDALTAQLAEEERRLAERARLASDSPLTPPVTDAGALVERWRSDDADPEPATTPTMLPESGSDLHADVPAQVPPPPSTTTAEHGAPTHVIARGSVIPAVLESSIDSDLPGLVRAKVAEAVHDTLTGRHVLIPRGSWLVGTYGTNTRTGQRRLFVSWTDLRLPDGTSIPLNDTGSLGADGASGVRGRRSTGIWTALGAAVLFDIAGNASQILIATETGQAPGRQGGLAELFGGAVGNSTSQVAQQHLGEILSRGTRFRVDAGARMNVLVEQDMHLPAQSGPVAWQ